MIFKTSSRGTGLARKARTLRRSLIASSIVIIGCPSGHACRLRSEHGTAWFWGSMNGRGGTDNHALRSQLPLVATARRGAASCRCRHRPARASSPPTQHPELPRQRWRHIAKLIAARADKARRAADAGRRREARRQTALFVRLDAKPAPDTIFAPRPEAPMPGPRG